MKSIYALALALLSCAAPSAQPAQKQSPSADHLNLTCAQILQMSSTDWIKKFTAAKDATEPSTIQAISAYGKCYDARTTRLAASLGKSGKGPLMGARGNFRDFQHALDDFTAKALIATDPPADAQKKAYAALYAKQFRYTFYLNYQIPDRRNPTLFQGPSEDVGDLGKAKNHFGELLGLLPDEKMHELHKSFSEIFDRSAMDAATRFELYLYAIYLLESPDETPYSPPPF
jgi:hypothetical protein